MKKNILIYKFSPEDLCVSRGGKVLLLDKNINWIRKFNLVPGEMYVIENPIIRELDKCRIITGGTFMNVGYFPAEIYVSGGPYIYNDKIGFSAYRVIKYKEIEISSKKIEDFEFPAFGNLPEEKMNLLGLIPEEYKNIITSFRAYIEWAKKEDLTILQVGEDFKKKVGYRYVESTEFIDPESIRSTVSSGMIGEPRLSKKRKSTYEEIFFDGKEGGEKETIETIECIDLNDSGLDYIFSPIAICPTGQVGKLIVAGYECPGNIQFPGDGVTGSYLQFAKEFGWLTKPPVLLSPQDFEWIRKGGKVAYSERSQEFYINYWDGTDYVWDFLPQGFLAQSDEPENPQGWVLVHYPHGNVRYIFDPNFSDEDYLRKVEEAKRRTLAFEKVQANRNYCQYTERSILEVYFSVEKINPEIDFLYGYLRSLTQKSLGELVKKYQFIIPEDGSGIYVRITKEHELYNKVRLNCLTSKVRAKLDELYPNVGWSSGWDPRIFDAMIKDLSYSDSEQDINTFEQRVLNLYQAQKDDSKVLRDYLEDTLKNTFIEFVSDEISEIYKSIEVSLTEAEDMSSGNFKKKFADIKERISKLPDMSKDLKKAHDAECAQKRSIIVHRADQMGIDEYLLDIFNGHLLNASQFIANVAKIEAWRLDAHELGCGRRRAREACEKAWLAMGESTDFFCGADPNDVKYYVFEYHFGDGSSHEEPKKSRQESWQDEIGSSNDAMAEALRRAGLIK